MNSPPLQQQQQQQPLSPLSASFHFSSSTSGGAINNRSSLNISTTDYSTIAKKKKQEPIYTEQELKECTFKPKISEHSKTIIQDYTNDPVQERTRQILEQREKRLQVIRNQLEEKKQMTFKPSIADYSFSRKRTNFIDSIDEQIQRRKEFLEKCEKERKEKEVKSNVATFTPQISETSKQLGIRGGNVFDRLAIPKTTTEQADDLLSLTTSPVKRDTKLVDDKLYNEAREREEKRRQIEETTREEEKKMKTPRAIEKSNEFFKTKMLKDLLFAFRIVDKQDSGFISKDEFESVLSNLGLKAMKNEDFEIIDKIWNLIDSEQNNSVSFQQYNTIMLSILDNSFITLDQEDIRNQIEQLSQHVKTLSLNKLAYCKIDEHRFERIKKENDKELTFKPKTNSTTPKKLRINLNTTTTSSGNGTTVGSNQDEEEVVNQAVASANSNNRSTTPTSGNSNQPRFVQLIKKQNEIDERKKKEQVEWERKKMSDCTFKPKTNGKIGYANNFNTNTNSTNNSRFDSLYNMAFQPKKVPTEKTREEKEMEECTFKPNRTNSTKTFVSKSVDFDSIRGIKETVGRIRKGNEERERLFTYFNSLRDKTSGGNDVDYKNKKTSFKPFSFQLDKRKRSTPVMFMDVNLGVGRSGRIGIHDGDRAEDLAHNFAQTYKIDQLLQDRLQELIRQQMIANQHLFSSPNNNSENTTGKEDDNNGIISGDGNDDQEFEMVNEEVNNNNTGVEGALVVHDEINGAEQCLNEDDLKIEDLTEHSEPSNATATTIVNTQKQSSNDNKATAAITNKVTTTTTSKQQHITNRTPTSNSTYRSKTPTMKNSKSSNNEIVVEKRSKTPTTDRYQSNNKFKF